MIDAPLALGLTAGMVAAFNPCGFAMLPAYLGFFLGGDAALEPEPGAGPAARALVVGGAVTAGFMVVFGVVGTAVTAFSVAVQRVAPWLTLPIGVALAGLGVAALAGRKLPLRLPTLARGGRTRGIGSMVVYGVSYATVSLSCTLPVFLAVVATTFEDADAASGLATYLAYALGMGVVLTGLALAAALAGPPLVARSRRVLPLVSRVSGALLVVAGLYVAWYALYEIRLERGDDAPAGPVDTVTGWSGQVSNWVDRTGAGRIAAVVVAATLLAALASWARSRGRRARADEKPEGSPRYP